MTNPYPQQQNPYPEPPMPPQGGPVAVQRPQVVQTSAMVWFLSIVCLVAGMIVQLFFADDIQRQALIQMGGPQGAQLANNPMVQQSAQTGKIIGLVIGLILAGVWLLFVMKMRAGRNWARVTMLVITILWCVLVLLDAAVFASGLPVTLPTISWVLIAATAVTAIVAVVLMYRPAARPYFSRQAMA